MMQQELLPFDKQEFADRCQAIERLTPAVTGLLPGQLKKVRDFLKRVFKHKWSAPNGTITFVRCAEHLPGANNLAIEFEVTGRTIDNWLRWAIQAGLIETSVSADRFGRRQTTLEFRWENIFALAELALQQRETEGAKAKRFPDQSETVSGPKRNGFATKAKRFPNQSETVSLSYTNVLPILPPPTKAAEEEAELKQCGSTLCVVESAEPVEVEQILKTCLNCPDTTRRLARLCDAATALDVVLEFQCAKQRGILSSPGAIAWRIETGQWPKDGVKTAAEIRASAEAAERRRAAERAAQAARERESERVQAAAVDLEARYGPILDAMSIEQRDTLAREVLGELMYKKWRAGKLIGIARELLLLALESNHPVGSLVLFKLPKGM